MRIYRRRKGGQAVTLIGIVMALAMLASFTLAWFMQELRAPDQRVSAAGKDGTFLELWAQTPIGSGTGQDGLYGTKFSAVNTFTTGAASAVTVSEGYVGRTKVEDPATRIECEQMTPNALYPLVTRSKENGGLVLKDPSKDLSAPDNDCNRLLNESGFLPGNAIKRRLIVRNTGGVEMSYLLSFEGLLFDDADYLAEAIRVDTRRVSFDESGVESAYDPARDDIPELSGLGAEELPGAKLAGTLGAATKTDGSFEPAACSVYEFSFTFAESATVIYAQKAFQADVRVDAQGILPIRYVSTADELSALLGKANSALPQGAKLVLTDDILLDGEFETDKLISIDLAGHTLTVTKKFVIDVVQVNGADPFGTIDIGMAETTLADGTKSCGSLIVQGKQGDIPAIGVRAPNGSVRWNTGAAFTQPDMSMVDARRWNGAKALNPTAEMPF